MNAFPPLPPFLPSHHRLPGHTSGPARERRRVEAVILPLEAHLARRIFHIRAEAAPPVTPPLAQSDGPAPPPGPTILGWLGRLVQVLIRGH